MKKIIFTLGLGLLILDGSAQVVSSTNIFISDGALVSFGTDVVNNGDLTNNGKMHLKGDLKNNAKLVSKGQVVVDGNSPQTFGGTQAIEFSNVSIHNDVNFQNIVRIDNKLILNNGIVNAISPIEMSENSTQSGASDFSHVTGKMRKNGNTSFNFPLGDGMSLKSFEAVNSKGGTIEAEYVSRNPMDVSSNLDYNIEEINQTEYWSLKSSNSNGVDVSLGNNNELTYLKDGVWVKETNRLRDASSPTLFTSGKGKNLVKEIGIWPNPTQGEFNLKLIGMRDTDKITVDITNQDGRVIMKMNGVVKDLRKAYTLPQGLVTTNLTVRVINGAEAMTQNLILNK